MVSQGTREEAAGERAARAAIIIRNRKGEGKFGEGEIEMRIRSINKFKGVAGRALGFSIEIYPS